jgi:hypothetical protein
MTRLPPCLLRLAAKRAETGDAQGAVTARRIRSLGAMLPLFGVTRLGNLTTRQREAGL